MPGDSGAEYATGVELGMADYFFEISEKQVNLCGFVDAECGVEVFHAFTKALREACRKPGLTGSELRLEFILLQRRFGVSAFRAGPADVDAYLANQRYVREFMAQALAVNPSTMLADLSPSGVAKQQQREAFEGRDA